LEDLNDEKLRADRKKATTMRPDGIEAVAGFFISLKLVRRRGNNLPEH
jgi:hypothetical protein